MAILLIITEWITIHTYYWILTSVHTLTKFSMWSVSDIVLLKVGAAECMTYMQSATRGCQDAVFQTSVTTISIGWVLGDHRCSSCLEGRATGTLTIYLFDLSSSFSTCIPTKLTPAVSRMRGLPALGGGGATASASASAVSGTASSAGSPSGTFGSSSAMFPADATRPQRCVVSERKRASTRFHVTCA